MLATDTQPVATLLAELQERVYVVTLPAVALIVTQEVQPFTTRMSVMAGMVKPFGVVDVGAVEFSLDAVVVDGVEATVALVVGALKLAQSSFASPRVPAHT
jgi:hypothetical protein